MGDCGCSKKTEENSQQPVADQHEESFRQAYLRECRKASQLAAQVVAKDRENVIIANRYAAHLEKLATHYGAASGWLSTAYALCPNEIRALEEALKIKKPDLEDYPEKPTLE